MVGRPPARITEDPGPPPPSAHLDAIDRRFRFGSVEEIFAAVENKGTDWVSDTLKNLRHMLPTYLKMNLRHMRPGPSCRSIMP
jgi:enoyl-CoA hydratase